MRAAVFLILSNWQNIGKCKISREGNKRGEREREREKKKNCRSATVVSSSNLTLLLLNDSLSESPGLTPWCKSTLACVEQCCPFSSTTYMNKSHHAALWNSLTITRYDPERDCVPGFLDQVDDVWVWLVGDGAAVNGQYSVPHFQLPAAVRWAALDDASYFVGHGHTRISSFCVSIHVCFARILCVSEIVCGNDWLCWLVILIYVL